jgi:hypothetical protein
MASARKVIEHPAQVHLMAPKLFYPQVLHFGASYEPCELAKCGLAHSNGQINVRALQTRIR